MRSNSVYFALFNYVYFSAFNSIYFALFNPYLNTHGKFLFYVKYLSFSPRYSKCIYSDIQPEALRNACSFLRIVRLYRQMFGDNPKYPVVKLKAQCIVRSYLSAYFVTETCPLIYIKFGIVRPYFSSCEKSNFDGQHSVTVCILDEGRILSDVWEIAYNLEQKGTMSTCMI